MTAVADEAAPHGDAGPVVAAAVAAHLRDVPDFPQDGIVFKDIIPLLADGTAWASAIDAVADLAGAHGPVDIVCGIEARGFMVAAALALRLGCGLVPVRKAGKLPPPTVHAAYELEYGSAEIEVPVGPLDGRRVYLVDDVLATGGTLAAAADLVGRAGGTVVGAGVLLELSFLRGRDRLGALDVRTLLTV